MNHSSHDGVLRATYSARIPRASATTSSGSMILESLVDRAAGGDREAQGVLLEQYWPLIVQVVRGRRRRAGGDETEDLEQSAALRILTSLDKHRWQGRSAFSGWVRRLAQAEVVDAVRHRAADKRGGAFEAAELSVDRLPHRPGRSPESRFDDQARLASLMEQIQAIKPEYGAALIMHHLGYAHAEIGEALDCSPEAARKLVSRGRARLVKIQMTGP